MHEKAKELGLEGWRVLLSMLGGGGSGGRGGRGGLRKSTSSRQAKFRGE